MTGTRQRSYEWAHGWIPLTLHAAILKAHGNHEAAERLLEQSRRRRQTGAEYSTPLHRAAEVDHVKRALRTVSDEDLAEMMGRDSITDEGLDVLVAELDRRDRAQRKAEHARIRRARRREQRDAAAEADYDARVAAGENAEDAYAAAYGIDRERIRRDEAIASLRSAGYSGKGLSELTRAAFRDHAEASYWAAEDVTHGYFLNKAGRSARIDPRSLFTGPEARARKYASDELRDFWQIHGRLTADDFAAGVLGGHLRVKGAAAWS